MATWQTLNILRKEHAMSWSNRRFSANGDGLHTGGMGGEFDKRKKEVADALNLCFKELNKLWEDAEKDLKEIPIPVDVLIRYNPVYDDDPRCRQFDAKIRSCLGFVKSKGGWRICVGVDRDAQPEEGYGWKPITECAVDLKIEAIKHLDDLREAVLDEAKECIPTLNNALAKLRGTIASWK